MTMTADRPARAPTLKDGRVVAIAGPVVDVEFPPDALPEINYAARDRRRARRRDDHDHRRGRPADRRQPRAGHLPEAHRRPAAAAPSCATPAAASPMPVGDGVLGHVFNVIGEPLDIDRRRAHRASTTGGRSTATPPTFDTLEPKAQMFETGIKVIDLLDALRAGRQDRPVRRRRRGQDRAHPRR